jgi:hypothetical protein
MQNSEIELMMCRELRHTGDKSLLQRTVIRPAGDDFVDGGGVNSIGAVGRFRDRQTLPWHTGVEDLQNQIEDAVIAEFTPRPTPGHRKVR